MSLVVFIGSACCLDCGAAANHEVGIEGAVYQVDGSVERLERVLVGILPAAARFIVICDVCGLGGKVGATDGKAVGRDGDGHVGG